MLTSPLFWATKLFWVLLLLISLPFSSLAAPPGCEEVLESVTDCTLPTIVKCGDEEPICTAESTFAFERKCLKCKNKPPKGKARNQQQKPTVARTSAERKRACHDARLELFNECQEPVLKCGKQPAICGGRDLLEACEDGDLMICESKLDTTIEGKSSAEGKGGTGSILLGILLGSIVLQLVYQ